MEIITDLNSPYYTRRNLELILGSNRRTLDYRISKLIDGNILERIKPGFFLNKNLLSQSSQKETFLEYVGSIAKYPSYISLEYALAKYGLIPESIYVITYITTKKPGLYSCKTINYKYRNIKPDLFNSYEVKKYNDSNYFFAPKFKALFDFIYLTTGSETNNLKTLLLNSRINWQSLNKSDKQKFKNYCQKSQSTKMIQTIKILKDNNLL